MDKRFFLSFILIAFWVNLLAQGKFMCTDGQIVFFSHTAIEDITAQNKEVASVIDAENGEVAVIVKITAFQFEKKLMQDHFNENYMESELFPKATFMGIIVNNEQIDYSAQRTYQIQVDGDMTIHGVVQSISEPAVLEVKADGLFVSMKFMLDPTDYGIQIPRVVRKNIAERLEISVNLKHTAI
jgi:polyisoprenoid-binding protein YceI